MGDEILLVWGIDWHGNWMFVDIGIIAMITFLIFSYAIYELIRWLSKIRIEKKKKDEDVCTRNNKQE